MTEEKGEARELPKGWALTTVKETIKIIDYRGRTPPYSENGIPHLRSSNIINRKIVWENLRYVSEETYQAYMTRGLPEKGDVLFTTEAPLGEVALAPEQRFSLAQRMMILRPKNDLLSSKFLLYQIENEEFQRDLSKSGTGTTVTGVSSRNFQPTPIILAPIGEQDRIVEKIEELFSELDQGIESLKTAQKQLKVYRQAVLKWAFEGKLTEEWRKQNRSTLKPGEALLAQIKAERENRYQQQLAEWETAVEMWEAIGRVGKKPTKPQKLKELTSLTKINPFELPQLPKNWLWLKLEECADVIDPQPNHRTPPKVEDGVPFISIQDFNKETGGINFDNARRVATSVLIEHIGRYSLEKGDFIIGKIGTVGKSFKVPSERFFAISANVVLIKPFKEVVNHNFLFYLIKSRPVEKQFEEGSKATTQAAFGIQKVRMLNVPIVGSEEQEQIVQEIESRLSICDQLEATIIENLQKAEALRQSILKQAFEGKLVPQDPNDEPAEKLLERIRQEKLKQKQAELKKPVAQLSIEGISNEVGER